MRATDDDPIEPVVTAPRVDIDELDWTEDQTCLWRGRPFTGVLVEHRPDGRIWSEVPHLDGAEHGWARDFHENGALKAETPYRGGHVFGRLREWFPDGRLRREARIEHGIEVEAREWDASGRLVLERRPAPGSLHERLLRGDRDRHGVPGPSGVRTRR